MPKNRRPAEHRRPTQEPDRPALPHASRLPAPAHGPAPASGGVPEKAQQPLLNSDELRARRRAVKDVLVSGIGGNVVAAQVRMFVGGESEEGGKAARRSAEIFVDALQDSVRPRDAIEQMLAVQMAWTHARLARLSVLGLKSTDPVVVRVVNDACDRAAATFRRQMLALAEYRRPPRGGSFVAIQQTNVANQQVVANGPSPDREEPFASNELGFSPDQALPPVAGGTAGSATLRPSEPAVAAEHRPADRGREGPRQPERPEAR